MGLAIDRKLLKWGSGYGLRLTTKEIEALGLKPGDTVHASVSPALAKNDLDRLPRFDFGPWPKGKTVRDVAEDAAVQEHAESEGRRARR